MKAAPSTISAVYLKSFLFNSMDRADLFTFPAANALGVVCVLHRVHVHLADFGAGAAVDALMFIHPIPEN